MLHASLFIKILICQFPFKIIISLFVFNCCRETMGEIFPPKPPKFKGSKGRKPPLMLTVGLEPTTSAL